MIGHAAAFAADRTDAAPEVSTMVGHLAAAFEIRAELASMHADLLAGRVTVPDCVRRRASSDPARPAA